MSGLDESTVGVAHEHYPQHGGGEVVADELARTFGAEVYTGFVNDGVPSDDVTVNDLFGESLLGPLIKRSHHVRDAFYQFAWTHVPELYDYDVVVTSGNNPGWFVPTDDQTVVSYVHSPQRGPYDLWGRTDTDQKKSPLQHLYSKAARTTHPEGTYADRIVANSDLVKRRITKYWGVDAEDVDVVYPPVQTEQYSRMDADTSGYYFTWSRLYPGKRIDEIVRACSRAGVKLVVGGDGPERERLEKWAGDSVEFLGFVAEEELQQRVSGAKAVIFNARNEDFGMVPIEAMAAGTPVIGVRDGFTRYQVVDGANGMLFDAGGAHLREAIRRFEADGVDATEKEIETFAEQFSVARFRQKMRAVVSEAVEDSAIEPTFEPPITEERSRVLADGGEQ